MIAATGAHAAAHPSYLRVELPDLRAKLVRPPPREEIPVICDEQLVVEYYAR